MPHGLSIAYEALHLLGGDIDWAGLPLVAEILGIDDIESAVKLMRLIVIEERKKR